MYLFPFLNECFLFFADSVFGNETWDGMDAIEKKADSSSMVTTIPMSLPTPMKVKKEKKNGTDSPRKKGLKPEKDSPKTSRMKDGVIKNSISKIISTPGTPSMTSSPIKSERKRRIEGKLDDSPLIMKKAFMPSTPAGTPPETVSVAGISGFELLKYPTEIFDSYNAGNWAKFDKVMSSVCIAQCELETKFTGEKQDKQPVLDLTTKGLVNIMSWLKDLADTIPDIIFRIEEKKLRKAGNNVQIVCKYSVNGTTLYELEDAPLCDKKAETSSSSTIPSAPVASPKKPIFPVKSLSGAQPDTTLAPDTVTPLPGPETSPFRIEQMPIIDSVGTLTMHVSPTEGKISAFNMIWANQKYEF